MPPTPTYKSQRSLLRALVLSPKVQSDFSAAITDPDLTYTALMETNNFAQIEPEIESDYQYAGKGHSFATDGRIIAYKSSMEISTRVDQFLAGWFAAMCMGKVVSTAKVAPDMRHQHVITWLDTNQAAKVSTLYVEDTQGLKRKFVDMGLTQLVLTGAEKGAITAKASFLGTGRWNDGAIVGGVPARTVHPQFLYGSDAVISIGPQGASTSMFPRVMSWEATFDRAVEECRAPGGGLYAAFLRYGNPVCKLKLVIAANETTDIRDWMRDQTALEIKISITSGVGNAAAQMDIFYPYVVLPKADLGEQSKYVAFTIDLDQNSILKPDAAEVCTVTVTNDAAGYLAAAA